MTQCRRYLSRVAALGVRSLKDVEVPLAPLTIIVGDNGSGKSNILRAINLCAGLDEWESDSPYRRDDLPPPADGWQRGILEHLHNKEDAYGLHDDAAIMVSMDVSNSAGKTATLTARVEAGDLSVLYQLIGNENELRAASSDIGWLAAERMYWLRDGVITEQVANHSNLDWGLWNAMIPFALEASLTRIAGSEKLSYWFIRAGQELFAVDLIGIIYEMRKRDTAQRMELEDIEQLPCLHVNSSGKLCVPLYTMSLGMRQFFPILVHSLCSLADNTAGTMMVEEPEISLHPRAQVAVGKFFTELVNQGLQMIFTTHSHYLVQGVLREVRNGHIAAEDVAVINCQMTAQGTEVERIPVTDDGRLEGWIPSFADVDDSLFEDWMNSLPEASQ
jgi:predicted ATPase